MVDCQGAINLDRPTRPGSTCQDRCDDDDDLEDIRRKRLLSVD